MNNIFNLVYSSVPSQDTTSRWTLWPACFRRLTAVAWDIPSKECPSTANNLSPHLNLPSIAAGDVATTNKTWMGSIPLCGSDPPTMLNPREVPCGLCKTTLFDKCNDLGNFCQYSHDGTKFAGPYDVSAPSNKDKVTPANSAVALSNPTAWLCVRPNSDWPFTDSKTSPFCGY